MGPAGPIPLVTAIIVNHATPELARRCIESALTSLDVPTLVVVVDTSGGEGVLTDAPSGVWVNYLDNVGYAGAINSVLLGVGSPFVLACNADVEFPEDGISELVGLFAEHPDLAIVGPRQTNARGEIVHAGILSAGDTSGGRGFGDGDEGQFMERYLEVEQVSGSVMLMRTDILRRLGGMPDSQLYFEDAALCLLARNAGYKVAYSAVRTFLHHVAASPVPFAQRAVWAAEGRRIFDRLRANLPL